MPRNLSRRVWDLKGPMTTHVQPPGWTVSKNDGGCWERTRGNGMNLPHDAGVEKDGETRVRQYFCAPVTHSTQFGRHGLPLLVCCAIFPPEVAWNRCQKFPNDPYQLSPKVYAEHEVRSANAVPERMQSSSFNHFSCHNHYISIQDGLRRLEPCSSRLRMSMEVVGDASFSAASCGFCRLVKAALIG